MKLSNVVAVFCILVLSTVNLGCAASARNPGNMTNSSNAKLKEAAFWVTEEHRLKLELAQVGYEKQLLAQSVAKGTLSDAEAEQVNAQVHALHKRELALVQEHIYAQRVADLTQKLAAAALTATVVQNRPATIEVTKIRGQVYRENGNTR